MAERFKTLTCNPGIMSSIPLHAGHVCVYVYSFLASLDTSCVGYPLLLLVCDMALKSPYGHPPLEIQILFLI